MNRKITIIISVFGLLVALTILGINLFKMKVNPGETEIKRKILEANYCDIDADCVNIGNMCPFGCNILVNKNEVEQISEVIRTFYSVCSYDAYDYCEVCASVTCKNKKCKKICE